MDPAKVERDERYDGIWVLDTSTELARPVLQALGIRPPARLESLS